MISQRRYLCSFSSKLIGSLLLIAVLFTASQLHAAEWMFGRSYYTHDPVSPVRVGPQSPISNPMYSPVQGGFYTSGYRQLRSSIQVGPVQDNYYYHESFGKWGTQY